MPIYEYECISCSNRFELLMSIAASDADISCPGCGNKDVIKVITTFATVNDPSSTTVPFNEPYAPSDGL
ncbi:MAG: zinc ribbon domain-containing protein [Dehalococcoidales bacterium]|nr:zinc ribbon domain-containing protein [Dehalococcoidales bacterium]